MLFCYRFVDWIPNAIDLIQFNINNSYLAVVRQNGDIEIWNIKNGWHLECTIKGNSNVIIIIVYIY